MADDPFQSMKREIMLASGLYLLIVILASLVSWYGKPFLDTLVGAFSANVSSILSVALITGTSLALGYVLVFVNLHNLFDRVTFGARKAVGSYIVSRIREAATQTLRRDVTASDDELSDVFYSFVDRQDSEWTVLRNLSFGIWAPYHIAMNWIAMGLAGTAISLTSIWARGVIDCYSVIPALFFLVTIALSFVVSQLQVRPKFIRTIAEPQLTKMLKDKRAEFDKIVRARFGSR